MRHQGVRWVFLAFILMLPMLMQAVSSRPAEPGVPAAGSFLWPTEAVLLGGLVIAGCQRRRLLDEAHLGGGNPPAPRVRAPRPHVALAAFLPNRRLVASWTRPRV